MKASLISVNKRCAKLADNLPAKLGGVASQPGGGASEPAIPAASLRAEAIVSPPAIVVATNCVPQLHAIQEAAESPVAVGDQLRLIERSIADVASTLQALSETCKLPEQASDVAAQQDASAAAAIPGEPEVAQQQPQMQQHDVRVIMMRCFTASEATATAARYLQELPEAVSVTLGPVCECVQKTHTTRGAAGAYRELLTIASKHEDVAT